MDNYGAGGIGAAIMATIGIIYTAFNHKKIRSSCCGRVAEASLDIGPTTPPELKVRVPVEEEKK
jgi:hypothetical protein